MKYLIVIIIVFLSMTSMAQTPIAGPITDGFKSNNSISSQTELDFYTLLSVSTIEDLDVLLADGYPTSELRVILEDESIPEEDRYWLDCRMRSVIAQLLHRFYDEQGNIIEVDADWISPGEDYWQEIMMINPPGELQEIRADGPSFSIPVETGYMLDLYGNEIGQLAAVSDLRRVVISRSGSIAAIQAGDRSRMGGRDMYFCFMYPDGSFKEIEFPDMYMHSGSCQAVSQDGSISAWNVYDILDDEVSDLLIFDSAGNEIERCKLPYPLMSYICISSDNRYVACSGSSPSEGSGILDRNTGKLLWFADGFSRRPYFSANSQFCALPNAWIEGLSPIIDLQNNLNFRISNERALIPGTNGGKAISISNDGRLLIIGGQIYLDGRNELNFPGFGQSSISPDRYFGYLGKTTLEIRQNFAFLDFRTFISEVE